MRFCSNQWILLIEAGAERTVWVNTFRSFHFKDTTLWVNKQAWCGTSQNVYIVSWTKNFSVSVCLRIITEYSLITSSTVTRRILNVIEINYEELHFNF